MRAGADIIHPSIREPFDRYLEGLIHRWSGYVAALGFTLVPLFLLLDWLTAPNLFGRFFVYRAVCTAAVVAQYVMLKTMRPTRYDFLHGYFFTVVVAGAITCMTVELGGFNSSYYAGLNLVMIGVSMLIPWRANHSAINGIGIILMYVLANALFGGPFEIAKLVNNLFFMGSTAVIGTAVASAKYQLIATEFSTREELVVANRKLDASRLELKAARDALWGEMEVAKRIQTSLLPENRRVGGYEVAARMSPAAEVGGDYYDIIQAGEDRNWIAIGDVSGHGVESGLVMMMTQTSILSLVRENDRLSPADVFSAVNDVLLDNISRLHAARYMTLNVVRLHDEGLTLAGKHQDVLVWRRKMGAVETVSNEGCWIGVVEDTRGRVGDQLIEMEVGDVALFFTDGATEAMNAKSEMYGEERLAAALAAVAERPLDEALEVLFADIAAFRAVQDDDVTMMLVRRSPEAGAGAVRPRDPAGARSSAA